MMMYSIISVKTIIAHDLCTMCDMTVIVISAVTDSYVSFKYNYHTAKTISYYDKCETMVMGYSGDMWPAFYSSLCVKIGAN